MQDTGTLSIDERTTVKELARRRVFVFVYVLAAIVFPLTALSEADTFLHALDDYVDIVVSIIAVILFAAYWKKPFQGVRTANRIGTVIGVIIILATIFAITQEIGNPEHFGNEIPSMILGVAIVLNGVL